MKMSEQALKAIREVEAIYDPLWNESNPSYAQLINLMYGNYYLALGNYNKALEYLNKRLNYYESQSSRIEGEIVRTKTLLAKVYFEKGNYKTAAEMYRQVMQKKEELNRERFSAQINEFRTIYELDKAELESERRLTALRQQRLLNTGLALACAALILIAALVIWSRKRIAEKNKGLYLQIKEQDKLTEELRRAVKAQLTPPATAPEQQKEEDSNARQQQLVSDLHHYLLAERNFSNPEIEASELALTLGSNRTALFSTVKAVTGKTLQEYINSVRLDEAKQLIETTEEQIESIAVSCGFKTSSTFYRLFRERYHISPAAYRKVAKRG